MMKYDNLMASILSNSNLRAAYGRVMSNGGSAGVDGMKVDDLQAYLKDHLGSLKQTLMTGVYTPMPNRVRSSALEKSGILPIHSFVMVFKYFALEASQSSICCPL